MCSLLLLLPRGCMRSTTPLSLPVYTSCCVCAERERSLHPCCVLCALRERWRVRGSTIALGGRLLHPSCSKRIGEATTPGPPGSSVGTPLDTTRGNNSSRQDPPPSNPSDPTLAWPLENDVYVLKPHGRDIRLTCGWMPKFRSWRWSCRSGANRWQHQS